MHGFGWSFYGFFVAAAVWVTCYFLWAWGASRREAGARSKRLPRASSRGDE